MKRLILALTLSFVALFSAPAAAQGYGPGYGNHHFGIEDPYQCGGQIWGVADGDLANLTITIEIRNDDTGFYMLLNDHPFDSSTGYYEFWPEYSDTSHANYIPALPDGHYYTVNYWATHDPTNQTVSGSYMADITNVCDTPTSGEPSPSSGNPTSGEPSPSSGGTTGTTGSGTTGTTDSGTTGTTGSTAGSTGTTGTGAGTTTGSTAGSTTSAVGGGGLPFTGASSGRMATVAVALLVAGSVIYLGARKAEQD